jgi:hypothetical protein
VLCEKDFLHIMYIKLLSEVITRRSQSPGRLFRPNRPVEWSLYCIARHGGMYSSSHSAVTVVASHRVVMTSDVIMTSP